jgi:HD-GYP domain-containing protein (c-di-GMP phosphodiesterase class II)
MSIRHVPDEEVRLAELVAALSLAIDLGLGQPMEHVLHSCRIALRLAEAVGLGEEDRAAVYYTALLAWVGCTADSHELAELFGDDIVFRRDGYAVDLAGAGLVRFLLAHAGAGSPHLRRARVAAALAVSGGRRIAAAMAAHCQVAGALAAALGLGAAVRYALAHNFARWDGRGLPAGVGGEAIALPMRVVHLADITAAAARAGGAPAAIRVARDRSGGQFDPYLVERFAELAPGLVEALDADPGWDAVIAGEPGLRATLRGEALDEALAALGDFADLRSPWFTGHSRAVAALAGDAARRLGLPPAEVALGRRAGLVHDLGRAGVPSTIWEKPGPLSTGEAERVRLHVYFTERTLARPAALARIGAVAAAHRERLDGSGYHRGLSGAAIAPAARVLAAADAYRAMVEPRPHRPALEPDRAAAELRRDAAEGRLDGRAAEAVLAAAGHRATVRRSAGPAGLTPREVEVLGLLARGATNREIARALVIADKTAANHVEHIYAKIGVSTRAAASLFAMRHGLVPGD